MINRNHLIVIVALFMILGILSACTDLAGEPEIVRTLPPPPTTAPINVSFEAPAGLSQGRAIFAQNCASCHGITGQGNGALVLSGQVGAMSDFTDPATIRDQSLQDWFDTITNGRLENLMPPWANALSPQERWAVAFYTYTMSYENAALEAGEAVYALQCASCHTEDGSATDDAPSLQGLVAWSEADLQAIIASHLADFADVTVPAEDELQAVTQYTRLLSTDARRLPAADIDEAEPQPEAEVAVQATAAPPPAAATGTANTIEEDQDEVRGILRGNVIQGTPGGSSVEGATAVIHIYDSQLREQIAQQTVSADGAYQYEEVLIRSDYAYRMTAEHNGLIFTSPVIIGDPTEEIIELDVTVYDAGATADDIAVTSRATQFNLTSQGLYVIEVINLVNNADRAFIREEVAGVGEPVSVSFELPQGARLQLDHTDPNRILLSDDGLTVADAAAVLPGREHYLQYGYLLPLESGERALTQDVPYTMRGPMAFFVQDAHLRFESERTSLLQQRDFNGQLYNVYEVVGTPGTGTEVAYTLALRADVGSGDAANGFLSRELLAGVLLVIGLLIIAGVGVMMWRTRQPAPPAPLASSGAAPDSEMLIKQIADLDAAFEAGTIDEGDYQQQRGLLKAQLTQVLRNSS